MPISTSAKLQGQATSETYGPTVNEAAFSGWFSDYLIAGLVVLVISFLFLVAEPKILHWFVIPTAACGLMMGADVVRWGRGSLDPFDPKGLAGIVVCYGWFVAPLLHVFWGMYGHDLFFTGDPRIWLGVAASANAAGIIFYKIGQRWSFKNSMPVHTHWTLMPVLLLPILTVAAIVGISSQAYFYMKLRAALRTIDPILAMQGTGWLLLLGDGLPLLFLIGLISWTMLPKRKRSWIVIAIVLALCATSQFVWAGLRGSRSVFVGAMFAGVALIHFYWRRLRVAHLLLGVALLIPYMYFYGFYKGGAHIGLEALESSQEREQLERQTGRNIYITLLGDLSRADVQARIANEVAEGRNKYQLRHGWTYLAALSKFLPHSLWDVILGDQSLRETWGKSNAFMDLNSGKTGPRIGGSRVYGLTGEAMLNFGFLGVPVVWLIYGVIMGWTRRKMYTLPSDDTRWPLMVSMIAMMMNLPVGDSDNLVYQTIKGTLVVLMCILLWSRRR